MNEDPLQRAGPEVSERPRAGLPLRLVAGEEHASCTEPEEPATTTYALARMNVIVLRSVREPPQGDLLSTEFSFAEPDVGSAVIHTCMTGNDRQSAHGWLFQSREPDLSCERPVAELAISSAGVSSVTPGCPPDYDAVRARVLPPQVTATPIIAVRTAKGVILIALAVTFILPWVALMMVADRAVQPEDGREEAFTVTPWMSTSTVDLPLPIVLATPPPAPLAVEEPIVRPVKARAVPQPKKPVVARAAPQKPPLPVERATEPPKVVQGASSVDAPVSQPPRVVLSQRAAPVVVETGAQRLAREQAVCEERGFVGKAFCREGARWRHCHPDKWDVAPECMVKADTMQ
jgi:hypothetical protein